MSDNVTCPAEGCDYTGVQSSVLGHYSGTQDDAHAGGYKTGRDLLETDSTTTTSENPVFGDIDPDADPDPEPDTSDNVELPCGCDSYDPSDAPDPPYKITCPDCGQSWRVTE